MENQTITLEKNEFFQLLINYFSMEGKVVHVEAQSNKYFNNTKYAKYDDRGYVSTPDSITKIIIERKIIILAVESTVIETLTEKDLKRIFTEILVDKKIKVKDLQLVTTSVNGKPVFTKVNLVVKPKLFSRIKRKLINFTFFFIFFYFFINIF